MSIASTALNGFASAQSYDTHRPTYPPTAVNSFLKSLNLVPNPAPNTRIIEFGAGTGKFTEILARREEGFEVVAVEPHEGMRRELEGKVGGGWKGVKGRVDVRSGGAEGCDVGEGWGDCAVAAQAFHWFATSAALKEIHRVLRPGAAFGMIWNVEDYNAPKAWPASPLCTVLKDILFELDDGSPRFRDQKWKDVFEEQMKKNTGPLETIKNTLMGDMPLFSLPLGEDEEEWDVWLSEEALWSRFKTLSQIAVLEGDKEKEVKDKFAKAFAEEDKNEKGEVKIHGRTYWTWTSRV